MTVRGSFSAKKRVKPMGRYTGQNIYYTALEKSGVRRKGGIHLLRHYPEFRTIQGNRLPGFIFKESG